MHNFTGYTYDETLDLHFAQNRFYDSEAYRFTQEDPIKDGANWYGYVANNPLMFVDWLGYFMVGTVMSEGAKSHDAQKVNDFLLEYGYMTHLDYENANETYTFVTTASVKKFQIKEGLRQTGTVDLKTWEAMERIDSKRVKPVGGFVIKATFEEEFWRGMKGSDKLNIVIKGNNITINYSPAIYISEDVEKETKIYRQGSYYPQVTVCKQPVDKNTYNYYLKRVVNGLKYWENNAVTIQGVTGTVSVNITTTRAESKSDADIKLDISDTGRGIALGSVGWTPGGATGFTIPLGNQSVYGQTHTTQNGDIVDSVSNVVAHEFGHLLGIMDAYAEWYNGKQDASGARADQDGIMRSPYYKTPVFSNTEFEMILYAWSTGIMQGYYEGGELLACESQAFFRN